MKIIYDRLPVGRENAIPMATLARSLGMTERALRAEIVREQNEGALILSAYNRPHGYFRPADGEQGRRELEVYCKATRARAVRVLHRLRASRNALRNVEGQTSLALPDDDGTGTFGDTSGV